MKSHKKSNDLVYLNNNNSPKSGSTRLINISLMREGETAENNLSGSKIFS